MSKKKSPRTTDDWKGFVNYHVSHDVKKGAAEYRASWDLLGNIVPTLVEQRYKLSIALNVRDNAVIASATGKDPENVNYQRTLSAFAPDAEEAVLRLCYIHFVVFEEVWPQDGDQKEDGW